MVSFSFHDSQKRSAHPRQVVNLDAGVGLDDLEDPLSAQTAKDVVDVKADEGVVHDGRLVVCSEGSASAKLGASDGRPRRTLQDLLCFVYIPTLVSRDEVGHSDNLLVVLVAVEGSEVSFGAEGSS